MFAYAARVPQGKTEVRVNEPYSSMGLGVSGMESFGWLVLLFLALSGAIVWGSVCWLGVRQVVRWIELGRLREKRRKAKEGQGVLEFERKAGA
jgi:hypothetical protein